MKEIYVDFDEDNLEIVLSGEIDKILSNRFMKRYLKDYFKFNVDGDKLRILCDENIEECISKIRDMLKKYGFHEVRSEGMERILNMYFEEEDKFDIFSEQASKIRNNICNKHDFEEFTISMYKNLKNRRLYSLQLLSAYHMAFAQNVCNFSVPGAGKTSIVYGAYAYLKNLTDENNKKVDRMLIVGPLSSFGPWEIEYMNCFGCDTSIKRLSGAINKEDRRLYFYSSNPAEITLISYASLASVKDEVIYFLKKNKTMVVLDEAHKIKNTNGGVIAQATLEIAKYCSSRVILTGTPAPNGYEDLYNMFKFIWPTKNIVKYHINQLRDMSLQKSDPRVEGLINSISPFFMRIRKSDLDIPNPINHPKIEVDMGPEQQKIYSFIEKKYIEDMINNQSSVTSKFQMALISAKMIRLMQAASNPSLLKLPLANFLSDEEISVEVLRSVDDRDVLSTILNYNNIETPSKYIAALHVIKNIIQNDGKVIVWAIFVDTIKEFQAFLESKGIRSQVLYGDIPIEKEGNQDSSDENVLTRERIVKNFHNSNCEYKVIIANPFAVAESISLHKACHNAIYLERSFNAAHFIQSKDRIHRYGLKQEEKTNYYYIVSKNSIDEVIHDRLLLKESRMNKIIESMPIPLFDNAYEDLGDEDIKALIMNYVRRTKKI